MIQTGQLCLLDANIIITPSKAYYPIDRFQLYWEWLVFHAHSHHIKLISSTYDEAIPPTRTPTPRDKILIEWLKENKKDLILDINAEQSKAIQLNYSEVLSKYGDNLTEQEIIEIGADYILISTAQIIGAVVVTKEISKPKTQRENRKIPDICKELGIECINDFELLERLDYRDKILS